ncbi:DUF4184 family protein [Pontibacter vulgaris]|uniref:DUF4184 family protein n=1 Tax=Pontibacter vulgaris TaxID=2905679 RepID=UPI001FA818E2|nr:DUF4184 family protein [Pontibacter vulgaris]
MPFTAAHPAIILPLFRYCRWLSVTGLVTGALAPDFEYFFRLQAMSTISHTLRGLFLFNLPVALLLATVFQVVVRDAVVQQLPVYFRKRALAVPKVDWFAYLRYNWHLFILSALIGSFSHLFWDSFTHYTGFFVRNYPILQTPIQIGNKSLILCRVLQHISTLIGFLALLLYIHRSPIVKHATSIQKPVHWLTFWAYVFFLGVSFMVCIVPIRIKYYMVHQMGITLISGWLLTVILLSTIQKLQKARQRYF